jgi:GTPase KRas protein
MTHLHQPALVETQAREYKIVVLGGGGVGKSALTIRLVNNNFLEEYDPTIEDSYRKSCELDGRPVMLDILDTAGQDDFAALRDAWMREAEGFLLVYSITKRATFDEVEQLQVRIMKVKEDEGCVPLVLVGNKCDLHDQRQVSSEEAEARAKQWGCRFYETSAKEEINNVDCFLDVARAIRDADKQSTDSQEKHEHQAKCPIACPINCSQVRCQCQCTIL